MSKHSKIFINFLLKINDANFTISSYKNINNIVKSQQNAYTPLICELYACKKHRFLFKRFQK